MLVHPRPVVVKLMYVHIRENWHTCIHRGWLQRLNTQRYCVKNCALRGLAHRNFSSQVLTIRALYDAFEIVISRIVTFLKSYRNCLVSLDLRFSFDYGVARVELVDNLVGGCRDRSLMCTFCCGPGTWCPTPTVMLWKLILRFDDMLSFWLSCPMAETPRFTPCETCFYGVMFSAVTSRTRSSNVVMWSWMVFALIVGYLLYCHLTPWILHRQDPGSLCFCVVKDSLP